jgi:hypothetical protein
LLNLHIKYKGAIIAQLMAKLFSDRINGIHLTTPFTYMTDPAYIFYALMEDVVSILPSFLKPSNNNIYKRREFKLSKIISHLVKNSGYIHLQATKPVKEI